MRHCFYTIFTLVIFSAANLVAQCYKDSDCPGNLICNGQGECVNPSTEKDESTTNVSSSGLIDNKKESSVNIYIIPKFGVNIFNARGEIVKSNEDYYKDEHCNYTSKGGIIAGAGVSFGLNKYFILEPDVFYSMRGFKVVRDGDDYKCSLGYIEFPINCKLTIPVNTNITPNVFLSPVLSFLTTKKATIDGTTSDIDLSYHSAEFAFAFGAGANALVQKLLLSFETRFLFATTNIRPITDSFKNWGVSFIMGAGFKVK